MVRELREDIPNIGFNGNAYAILVVVLVTICIMSAIVFSCADGVSKENSSAADQEPYGAGCSAGCGAGCGA
ncbi:hypothetical protein RJT34_26934 [Clitoria ternatea]|uniref:Transmembrane protein n=1 Tax=Clitoria ternatea TaxID=43366 RepID=A0AAN9FG06_CLITE